MQYKPQDLEHFDDVMGKEVVIALTGYGSDSENSGFSVQLPEEIKKYFLNVDEQGNLKIPHITTSLSEEGEAVNTMNLKFEDLEKPILIRGSFGAFVKEDEIEYVSFDITNEAIQEK